VEVYGYNKLIHKGDVYMNNFLDFASTRRSIRKFENRDIPDKDIEYFIRAAANAPSGGNSQCWKFIAVRDRDAIKRIEGAVVQKAESVLKAIENDLPEKYMESKRKMVSFFTKAPVVIAVFMTQVKPHDPVFWSAFRECGYDDKKTMEIFANYDLLSVGAAVQNMLLAIHEKGYGACWMNEPAIAGEEINRILGVDSTNKFISLVPVGYPAYTPREKKLKELSEILTIV
jgi:nitroreductase